MVNIEKCQYAIKLFHEEKYDECLPIIKACVDEQMISAMEVYGLMLQFGLGMDRDIEKAITTFENAAALGSGVAAHNLGSLYQTCGDELNSNLEKSRQWFKKAIQLGFVVSTKKPT